MKRKEKSVDFIKIFVLAGLVMAPMIVGGLLLLLLHHPSEEIQYWRGLTWLGIIICYIIVFGLLIGDQTTGHEGGCFVFLWFLFLIVAGIIDSILLNMEAM